jgi:hypothetical protein
LIFEKNTLSNNCPLCGQNNFCGNLLPNNNGEAWGCIDSSITFPDSLLSQVTEVDKNKVCICKTCALSHQLGRAESN